MDRQSSTAGVYRSRDVVSFLLYPVLRSKLGQLTPAMRAVQSQLVRQKYREDVHSRRAAVLITKRRIEFRGTNDITLLTIFSGSLAHRRHEYVV